jgi:hypothetical protein
MPKRRAAENRHVPSTTNKQTKAPASPAGAFATIAQSLSTDLDVDAGSGPSDLHTRVAIPIAALLDNHIAIAGAAAANRDIAVAIALDALLVAERSDAVLVADALGARRQRDQGGACHGNCQNQSMGCSHLRSPSLISLKDKRQKKNGVPHV